MNFLARDLSLSGPQIERGGFDIEPDREIFDRKQHELSFRRGNLTTPPVTVRPRSRRRMDESLSSWDA